MKNQFKNEFARHGLQQELWEALGFNFSGQEPPLAPLGAPLGAILGARMDPGTSPKGIVHHAVDDYEYWYYNDSERRGAPITWLSGQVPSSSYFQSYGLLYELVT